uniref:fibronectin-like n=1 Tax=Myxine glutinosa TaxID=7769 RepID=UPI00358F5348
MEHYAVSSWSHLVLLSLLLWPAQAMPPAQLSGSPVEQVLLNPDIETCFDEDTGKRYAVGETWQLRRRGSIWHCRCIGSGTSQVRCTTEVPATGDDTCLDNETGRRYHAGDTWIRRKHGSTWDCTCLESGNGQVDCTTEDHCQVRGHSYTIGQRWQQRDSRGKHMLDCVCLGNGKGEWKCDGKETIRVERKCKGVNYVIGQSWLKKEGKKRFLCTCHKEGISCHSSDILTFGGNAPGQSCIFPFTFMGIRYDTCTAEGRHDGKRWCSVTKKYSEDKRYTFCREGNSAIVTKGGNSDGAICNFPFFYNGHKYTECTSAGRSDDMQWCSTTETFDIDHKFGFCPMELHEEVCVSHGVQYHVGDTWNMKHELGYMMQCTCNGNGRGAWRCQAYSEILDQCVVEGNYYNVSATFHKQHVKGYMMNCTCYGQGRGRWACDPIDQCEDLETNHFYQIGDEWNRVFKGQFFMCTCYGKGTGEWSCKKGEEMSNGRNNPVDVSVVHTNKHHTSQPLEWTVRRPSRVHFYLLKWRPKDSRDKWREAQIPSRFTSYMITGLSPGVSYQGQLVTQFRGGGSSISKFEFATASDLMQPDVGVLVTEIHSNSFTLSWPSSPVTISGYRVQYELTEGGQTPLILELDGSATSAVLRSLLPGRNYFVAVFEIDTHSREKLIIATSSNTAPAPPLNYDLNSITDREVSISWRQPPYPITGYRVQYQPSAGGKTPFNLNLGPHITSTILTDLLPNTRYNVSIYSVLDLTESAPLFLQFSTHGQPASDGGSSMQHFPSPQNVKFEHVTDTQAAFAWSPTSKTSNLIGYQVNYGEKGHSKVNDLPMTVVPYAEITALQPGTAYDVEVTAIYENGHSHPAAGELRTKIDGPRHVQALEVSETEVTLGWQPPLAPITGYIIRCERTDGNQPREEVVGSTDTEFTMRDLEPGTEYVFTIYATHNKEKSSGSSTIVSTPIEDTQASDFLIETLESSIIVSWNSLPQKMVTVSVKPLIGGEDSREFTSDIGSLVVTDLKPGVDYSVIITAFINGRQQGPPIERIVSTALPPPMELTARPIENPGELRVSWKTTKLQGVTSYRITCTPTDARDDPAETLQEVVGPTQNHTEFHKLVPGKEYNVSAYTVADTLQSLPASMIIIPEIPAPKNMSIVDVSGEVVLLSWSLPPIDDHAGFWLEVHSAGSEPILSTLLDPTDRQYKISGLEPGVEYEFSLSTLTMEGQSYPVTLTRSTVIPSPTNLFFDTVTEESFRVNWQPPKYSLASSFIVRYFPRNNPDAIQEVTVPAGRNSVVLKGLHTGTLYIVHVHARIITSESVPLIGQQNTVLQAPTGITFSDVTPTSFSVSWEPAYPVDTYHVIYGPDGARKDQLLEKTVSGTTSKVTLTDLLPDNRYTIAVYIVHNHMMSEPLRGHQTTGIEQPRSIRVTNVDKNSMDITWVPPAEGSIEGYMLTYRPSDRRGRPITRTYTKAQTKVTITGLQPSTEYIIRLYSKGVFTESEPVTILVTTGGNAIQNVDFEEVGPDFIVISWHKPRGLVTGYRITCEGGDQGEQVVPHALGPDDTGIRIEGLRPGVEYAIRIYITYSDWESRPITVHRSTVLPPPMELTFPEVGAQSITLNWHAPSIPPTSYRIVVTPLNDRSPSKQLTLEPTITTTTVDELQPNTKYRVLVYAVNNKTASQPLQGLKTTLQRIVPPRNLIITRTTEDSATLRWRSSQDDTSFHLVVMDERGEHSPVEIDIPPRTNTYTVNGLQPGQRYLFTMHSVRGSIHSEPISVAGATAAPNVVKVRETTVDEVGPDFIVISWQKPRGQITGYRVTYEGGEQGEREVPHAPGPDNTNIRIEGLMPGVDYIIRIYTLYGRWESPPLVSRHSTASIATVQVRETTVDEVGPDFIVISWQKPRGQITGYRVTYEGGEQGEREVPHAPGPDDTNIRIEGLMPGVEYTIRIYTLYGRWESPPRVSRYSTAAPNVVKVKETTVDEVGPDFIVISWQKPRGQITGYRVTYEGGEQGEREVPYAPGPDDTNIRIEGLMPGVEYTIRIYTVYGRWESPPLVSRYSTAAPNVVKVRETTVDEVGPDFIVISWQKPRGQITGYRVTYEGGEQGEREVPYAPGPDDTNIRIEGLMPGVEYTIRIYTVYGRWESPPLVSRYSTAAPNVVKVRETTVDEVGPDFIVISWQKPRGQITGYRVTYEGGEQGEREVLYAPGPDDTNIRIEGLMPGVEYTIRIYTVYGRWESPPRVSRYSTAAPNVVKVKETTVDEVGPDFIVISWQKPRGQITGYRVTYEGGEQGEREVPYAPGPDDTNIRIEGLMPGVEYTIRIYTVYGRWESPPLVSRYSTAAPNVVKVRQTTVDEVGPDFIVISWRKPRGQITGYRITYEGGEQGEREVPHAPGPDDTNIRIEGLMPGVEYTIRIYTLYGRWESPPLVSRHSTASMETVQVSETTVNEVGPDFIVISWQKPRDQITGYRVTYEAGEEGEREVPHAPGPHDSSVRIEGLRPNVIYIIRIYTLYRHWESPPLVLRHSTGPSSSVQVSEATADEVGPDFIVISWAKPHGQVTGYRVTYEDGEQREKDVLRAFGPDDTNVRIEGLILVLGMVELARFLHCCIKGHIPDTGAPSNLEFIKPSPDSITLRWTPPHGPVTGYLIMCQPARGGELMRFHQNPKRRQFTIPNLQANTRYVISLVADYKNGRSQPVRGSVFTQSEHHVKVPSPVSPGSAAKGKIEVVGIPFGRITFVDGKAVLPSRGIVPYTPSRTAKVISWNPRYRVSQYLITCSPIGHSGRTVKARLPGSITSARLIGLRPGLQYRVLVEGLSGRQRFKIMEEVISLLETVSDEAHSSPGQCYDRDTGRLYKADDEWEKDSGSGLKLLCRCLVEQGRNHIRCDSSRWCLDRGKSYNIGETWSKTTARGRRMKCTCLGNNVGQFKCEPDEATCFYQGKEYSVGQQWTQRDKGMDCRCTCVGGRKGYRCDCGAYDSPRVPYKKVNRCLFHC